MKKKMLKLLVITLAMVMTLGSLTACFGARVESLTLSNTELKVNVGDTTAVTCVILPEKANSNTVTWVSSDSKVATVSDVGVVTGVGEGTCTITASAGDVTATVAVTVKIPVEEIVLDKSEVTIKEEETVTLTYTITPDDASESKVTWTSSDESIAKVNSKGVVTGVKAGECKITATIDGKKAVAEVTVKEKGPDFQKLYNEIDSDVKYGWEVGSDGSYLTADTNVYNLDDYSNWAIWDSIKEMNEKLGLPNSLNNDMNQTSWSMGKQKEVFESVGIEVSWTYHPDKGMEVTYKLLED